MMKNTLFFLTLIAPVFFFVPVQAGERESDLEPMTLTLDEVLTLGLKNRSALVLAEKNLEFIQSQYRLAQGNFFPDVTLTASYTRHFRKDIGFANGRKLEMGDEHGASVGADVEQPLYSGGRLTATKKSARWKVSFGEENSRSEKDETIFALQRLYYMVLLASATVSIQKDSLLSAEEHLQTIQDRYEQGLDSDLTLMNQEVEVALARPGYSQARYLLESALTSLKEVLKMDVDRPLTLVGALDFIEKKSCPDYNTTVRLALERNPDLLAARYKTQSAGFDVVSAQGDEKPQLSLFGKALWQTESPDLSPTADQRGSSLSAGLRMRYRVFTGRETSERVHQARIAYEIAQENEDVLKRSVHATVKSEWQSVQEALERVQSQEAALAQAEKALESTEKRFQAGQTGQLDLSDATLSVKRVRMVRTQALADFWIHQAALEKTVGTSLSPVSKPAEHF